MPELEGRRNSSDSENSPVSGEEEVRREDQANDRASRKEKQKPEAAPSEDGHAKVTDDEPDISCGIGSLRTNIFGRRFANLYVFAICFALSNFFTSMVQQVFTIQLTSLERQFNIDNAHAGLFETASKAGFISTVLFAGHFAKKSHIPLIIGASGVLQGIVLTIPAIMQLADPYELPLIPTSQYDNSSNTSFGDNGKYLCETNYNGTNTTSKNNSTTGEIKQAQFIVILVVQVVKGISDTFHSGFLPTLYMDDNLLDKSKMGIFLGIWQVISELSGPIGKQINGVLTKVPIDLKDTKMGPDDKRFVSAWWLALFVFGLGTAVFSLPIMFFPRKLISSRQREEALAKAVVTWAGGETEDEVAEPVEDKPQELESVSKPISRVGELSAELSESTRTRYSVRNAGSRNNSIKGSTKGSIKDSTKESIRRKGSGVSVYSGSRRPSLFPPVVGPTERKVSIAGDLIFDQPVKTPQKKESVADLLKDFPRALVRVLRKPVFILLLIDVAIVSIPISGAQIFRSAYMANEYNVPMSEVALISGITSAVGHIAGSVVSSWVTSKAKTRMGYIYLISSTYFMTCIVIPFYFIIGCGNEPVYGAEGEIGIPVNISHCGCDPAQQLISCGKDGRNYISPCYAGCTSVKDNDFFNCYGINSTEGNSVTPGLCATDCHTSFILYASLHGVHYFFSAMANIPRRLLILRIVDPQDRGFATSLFMFCFIFTGIPSPNLFGKVIDGTCLIWDGSFCSLYDRTKIRYLMSGIDIGVHGCVQLTFLIMMCIFKWDERRAKKQGEKDTSASGDIETVVDPPTT